METYNSQDIDLRTEEVQEILGTPPHWLLRWGILIAFAALTIAAYLAFYISHPRAITLEGKVYNEEPTRSLLVTKTNKITNILVENEDTIHAGQTLLVYDAIAEFSDVLALDDDLHNLSDQPSDSLLLHFPYHTNLVIGELDEYYLSFLQQLDHTRKIDSNPQALAAMTKEEIATDIRRLQRDINYERNQREQVDNQYRNALQDYQRLVNLRAQGKANDYQIRQAESLMLSYKRLVQEKENDIRINESRINALRNQRRDNAARSFKNRDRAVADLRTELRKLRSALDKWKNDKLLVAPVGGIVILADDVKVDAYVEEDKKVAEIRSASSTDLIGQAKISLKESGFVQVGQRVLTDFYNFPAAEHGHVEGVVAGISQIPDAQDELVVSIRFPIGLVTTLGRQLAVGENMVAEIQIIVEEKRIMEWLLQSF